MSAAAQRPGSRALREFFSTFCWDEYYPPMDGPYQNFTYFPAADLEAARGAWEKTLGLIRAGRAPREVGLYVHWPFCPSRCAYCFCSMAVPGSAADQQAALERIRLELDAFKDLFRGFALSSVWLGGGTPTFLPEAGLRGLLGHIRSSFALEPGAQVYVEASPATLTPGKVRVLAEHGVNRVTLGVQSLDPAVLARASRAGQSRGGAGRALEALRSAGVFTDLDLMLGLEGQSKLSFLKDVAWALERRPSALHLFAYEPRPQTLWARQGRGRAMAPREQRLLMELADRFVRGAGYRVSRIDPRTLEMDCPEERQDGAARRLGASVLGVGPSAVSHAFGSAWYCHPLAEEESPGAPGLPAFRLRPCGLEEEMRGFALRHLALFGRLRRRAFAGVFGADPASAGPLRPALEALEARGLLDCGPEELRWTGRDAVEKHIELKRLYSRPVAADLLRGRGARLRAFGRLRRASPERALEAAASKAAARSLFRVYFASEAGA